MVGIGVLNDGPTWPIGQRKRSKRATPAYQNPDLPLSDHRSSLLGERNRSLQSVVCSQLSDISPVLSHLCLSAFSSPFIMSIGPPLRLSAITKRLYSSISTSSLTRSLRLRPGFPHHSPQRAPVYRLGFAFPRMASTLPRLPVFEAISGHDPDSTVVVHSASQRTFRYGELLGDVCRMRNRLLEAAGRDDIHGERIAFLVENSYDYVGKREEEKPGNLAVHHCSLSHSSVR